MAAGLMTLAYMGEMAMVFNLAYLELNKGRYIAGPKKTIDELRITIEASFPVVDENDWIRGKTKIVDRLQDLVADKPTERQHSWYVTTNHRGENKINHSDWLACDGYDLFEKERDKGLCQNSLILSALLLIAITVLDNQGLSNYNLVNWMLVSGSLLIGAALLWLGHFLYIQLRPLVKIASLLCFFSAAATAAPFLAFQAPSLSISIWWFCFWFFLLAIFAPIICIHFGRRVRSSLDESIGDAKRQFEDLKAKVLPNGLNSAFGK